MNRQSGTTLLELVLALTILTGVLGSVLVVQRATSGVMSDSSTAGQLHDRTLTALEASASELRWANPASLLITTQNGSARIDLQTPTGFASGATAWSSPITYQVDPSPFDTDHNGTLDEGRLVRIQGGVSRTLCDNVVPGGFSATMVGDNVQLQLQLTARHSASSRLLTANATTSISIRN